MISKILSRVFWALALLVGLFALANLVIQLSSKPISIGRGDQQIVIGSPGMLVKVSKLAGSQNGVGDSLVNTPLYANNVTFKQEGTVQETLRIAPTNNWQQAGKVFYDVIWYGCLAIFFLALFFLFDNFSKGIYFSADNISMLRDISFLILLPQLMAFLTWWFYLRKLEPVQTLSGNAGNAIFNYTILPGTNWTLILLGIGLVVLSLVFKDGLETKEEYAMIA